jgi:uncharacterized membrane protein YccC
MDASATRTKIRRLLRLGVSDGTDSPDTGMGELEMELALLREENARLKVERHRAPDAGRIIERMRHLGETPGDAPQNGNGNGNGSHAREAAETLIECLAIRDALVQACNEVQQAMQGIRSRLGGLSPEALDPADEQAVAPAPPRAEVELELALGASAQSDLSQSAA